jgi:hypothetical protein
MMKIYFTCSARGTQEYGKYYERIYQAITKMGHQHLDDYHLNSDPNKVYNFNDNEMINMYKQTIKCISRSDVVVLEVSKHSLTMGYLIQRALDLGKPVVALHRETKYPMFMSGIDDEKMQILEYSEDDLEQQLKSGLEYAVEQIDTRFNFFVAPKHQHYLDWVAKNMRIPRAVYLRRLIEEDMRGNKEYQKE